MEANHNWENKFSRRMWLRGEFEGRDLSLSLLRGLKPTFFAYFPNLLCSCPYILFYEEAVVFLRSVSIVESENGVIREVLRDAENLSLFALIIQSTSLYSIFNTFYIDL